MTATQPMTPDWLSLQSEEIRVQGTVQGVGFRPTVYRLAKANHLCGDVCNDGQGVLIRVVGPVDALNTFVEQLQQECPPLAQIEAITRTVLTAPLSHTDFTIAHSVQTSIQTEIAADAATCPQCRAETLDPSSRWYRYPFTNCTHCGPRLSIIQAIPYDRIHTSMAAFPMCTDCAQEYRDVTNRRFHAQPIACPVCGPRAWLERADGAEMEADPDAIDDVDTVATLLQQGAIVAIKGLGGIHLACDATQEATVQRLRQRKHRDRKPFALMVRDLSIIEPYCDVNDLERSLLQSPVAPIVLLQRKSSQMFPSIADSVAPGLNTLGVMLPYTPLHHLILQRIDRPLVFTSGNLSDEPQCIENQQTREQLGQIADYFLMHNRAIVNRMDDSVVRVVNQQIQVLRRARGYAPAPIRLPAGFEQAPDILAMGSELKNTFCLLQSGRAILSQHLGDLEHATAYEAYQATLKLYLQLFEHHPAAIAVDLHPEYLSTKLGHTLAEQQDLPLYPIQHHHAHIAACLIDNQLPLENPPVLGIALDGLGYGADDTLWGGEFLLADYRTCQRLGHFQPIAMLGGEQAIYQPWRNTYAHLMSAFGSEGGFEQAWHRLQHHYPGLDLWTFLEKQPRSLLNQMLAKGIQAPLASSAGRLFDAVAAAIGLCRDRASYEGQGAIELEALIDAESLAIAAKSGYPFAIEPYLDAQPMWQALLRDLCQDIAPALIAAKFHIGLAQAIVQKVEQYQHHYRFTQVALSGGVFQNRILLEQVIQRLESRGLTVLTHHRVPANDGGLALGQIAIAAAQLLEKTKKCGNSKLRR